MKYIYNATIKNVINNFILNGIVINVAVNRFIVNGSSLSTPKFTHISNVIRLTK